MTDTKNVWQQYLIRFWSDRLDDTASVLEAIIKSRVYRIDAMMHMDKKAYMVVIVGFTADIERLDQLMKAYQSQLADYWLHTSQLLEILGKLRADD